MATFSNTFQLNATFTSSTFNFNNYPLNRILYAISAVTYSSITTIAEDNEIALYLWGRVNGIAKLDLEYENWVVSAGGVGKNITSAINTFAKSVLNPADDVSFTGMGIDIQAPATVNVTANFKVPVINNINISQSDPRQSTTITWNADIQDSASVQVWQGGFLRTTLSATGKSVVMPANTVSSGVFTVSIIAVNNPVDNLGAEGTASKDFTAIMVAPSISNLAVNQVEPRLPINLSWTSTNQTNFKADVIQNGALKASLNGGAINNTIISANTLIEGDFTINIYVNNVVNGVVSTVSTSQTFKAILDKPVITSLEPDKINNNVNLPILCTWASSRQETYILKLIQDNAVKKVYSGTTEQQLNIPMDTFESGICRLELTTSNTVNATTVSTTRISEFLGYSRPKLPLFTEQTIYNQALPLFKWTADNQIAFKFETWKKSILIEKSNEVISTISEFQATTTLENNSEYIIKVQTKNQFGLWSYVSEKSITTNYSTLTKPDFTLIPDASGGILINLSILDEVGFATAEIWRKDEQSKFIRLATNMTVNGQWTDYTVASNKEYSYKIISLTNDGGLTESDVKKAMITINGFNFLDLNKTKPLKLKKDPKVSSSLIRDVVSLEFAGRTAPKLKKGLMNYRIFKMSFELNSIELNEFMELIDAETILYKDGRGNKAYGQITNDFATNPVKSNLDRTIISFTFSEISFIERDLYDGIGG